MMKLKHIIHALSLTFCLVSGILLSSCLNDDNNDGNFTPEESRTMLSAMSGTYSGKALMLYLKSANGSSYTDLSSDVQKDSVSTYFSVRTDSTLTVQFPVSLLAHCVTDSTNTALISALQHSSSQTLTCKIYLEQSFTNSSYYYGFYALPQETTTVDVGSGTNTFRIKVGYAMSATYFNSTQYSFTSIGQYILSGNGMAFYILPGTISVNGEEQKMMPCPILFTGNR